MQVLLSFGFFIVGIIFLIKGTRGLINNEITAFPYFFIGSSRKVTATGIKAIIWSLAMIIGGFALVIPFIGNVVIFLR